MALGIDATAQLRRQSDLAALVRAIVAADETDETAAVEWKSELDLAQKGGQFLVAKNVLGLANRDPARAAAEFEGWGYFVIGAAPGSAMGTSTPDPANYVAAISEYTGDADGPPWRPAHVAVDGVTYVVVQIDPPRAGDPPWPLRKEYNEVDPAGKQRTWQNGTIFIRRPGRTEQANASDIDMLAARAQGPALVLPDVEVTFIGDVPLSWLGGAPAVDHIKQWLAEAAEQRKKEAADYERRRNGAYAVSNDVRDILAISRITDQFLFPDGRTLDEYGEQIDRWLTRANRAIVSNLVAAYASANHGLVNVRITNRSDRYLKKVQVRLGLRRDGLIVLDRADEPDWLESMPRRYGSADLAGSSLPDLSRILDYDRGVEQTWIDGPDLVFDVGDLRPRESDESDSIWLVLARRPDHGVVPVRWRLTAEDMHAVVEGTVEIPVAVEPFEWSTVLPAGRGSRS